MMKLMVFALIVVLASPSYAASLRSGKAVFRDGTNGIANIRKERSFGPYGGGEGPPNADTMNVVDFDTSVDAFLDAVVGDKSSEEIVFREDLQAEINKIQENLGRLDSDEAGARIESIRRMMEGAPTHAPAPATVNPAEAAAEAQEQLQAQQSQQEQQPTDPGQQAEQAAEAAEQAASQADTAPSASEPAGGNNEDDDGNNNNNNNQADAPTAAEAAAQAAENNAGAQQDNGAGAADSPAAQEPPQNNNGNDFGNEDTKS